MISSFFSSRNGFELLLSIFVVAIGLGVAWAALVAIYNIFFHPLAKFPGPTICKITDLHQTWHAYKGDRHLELWRLHQKYGKFVRFGPNSLSINSNTALKDIYGFKSNVRKSDFYTAFPPTKDTFNTHSSIDKAAHARKRRVLSHAFSDSAIKSMEEYILGNVSKFYNALASAGVDNSSTGGKGWSLARNMADWCNYLTFDIMGDLCFGKAFGMLESDEGRFAIPLLSDAAHRHLICGTMPLLHDYHLDKVLFPHVAAGRTKYMQYSQAQAAERTKVPDSGRRDFFYYLLNAVDPETGGPGFSPAELRGESNLLIIAGSDTTSCALAAAFFYLVHSPRALAALTAEVRRTFSSLDDIVSGPALGGCVYLRAVLDEALRLAPPVSGLLPRTVLPGGLVVDGVHLPAGVDVGVPHYALHHHPAYYPRPFTFVPERWIVDAAVPATLDNANDDAHEAARSIPTDAAAVRGAQSAFCPFSVGPRGCIGKGLAYVELSLALARVVWGLDMRVLQRPEADGVRLGEGGARGAADGRQRRGEYQLQDTFTSLKDGPLVQFRRRQDVAG